MTDDHRPQAQPPSSARLGTTQPHTPAPGSTPPQSQHPEIIAEYLEMAFADRPILNGINLKIHRAQILAIVGGSGSGKTVLLHLLAGLLTPTAGRVLVADHSQPDAPLVDMHTLDDDARDQVRLHWAMVFQRNALFSGSVRNNLALLLREHTEMSEDEIRTRARQSLADADLDVDDIIDKDRDELSGGMAKRVAIARAIAIDPAVIFYDEPTTGLDPVTAAHIHELIWNTHHRPTAAGLPRTTILVTHDKELLRRLHPDVVMLDNGSLCFAGTYTAFTQVQSGPPHEYLRTMPALQTQPPPP